MNVGIVYIAIGKYILFWENFYLSSEKYLFPNVTKRYFVFTDSTSLYGMESDNVNLIYQKDLGWPGNTLYRFKMIYEQKNLFCDCDYLFFFNANSLFVDYVSVAELIPSAKDNYLACLSWHVYENRRIEEYPYERNVDSAAYIPSGSGVKYYQGGLNGGRVEEYLEMVYCCMNAIKVDDEKNIIAVSNDESHMNKYLLDKQIKVLGTTYGKPEEWDSPDNAKIVFRNKNALLGIDFMQNLKPSLTKRKYSLHRFFSKILNYLFK